MTYYNAPRVDAEYLEALVAGDTYNPPPTPRTSHLPEAGDAGGTGGNNKAGAFKIKWFSDIEPEEATYLVDGLIPDASLTVLVGEEGIGKGLWWTRLTQQVTSQGHRVLIIAPEDDLNTAVRPRLDVAGVKPDMAATMVMNEDTLTGTPVLPTNNLELKEFVKSHGFKLVIIDPWVSVVPSRIKVANTQEARQALDPLVELARELDIAILAVIHPNRGEGSLRDRVGLTVALRQAARVMLFALEDPEDDTTLYVGVEKANGAARGPAAAYRKVPCVHSSPRLRKPVYRLEPMEDWDDARTIRELAESFNRTDQDGRTSDRWPAVVAKAAKNSMLVSRLDIEDLYKSTGSDEKAADKAIARWVRNGQLTRKQRGVFEVNVAVKPD